MERIWMKDKIATC